MIILEAADATRLYWFPGILAILTAAISGLVAYQIAKRQHSGRIETSAAADLWAESRSIREILKQQVSELTKDLEQSHVERLKFKTELEQLKLSLVEAQGQNRQLAAQLTQVRGENEMLRGANLALARRVTELETKAAIPTVLAPVTVVQRPQEEQNEQQ